MFASARFAAYRTAMSVFTLASFRTQQVTPLGLPEAERVGVRPFGQAFPTMPVSGLVDPTDFPAADRTRLRRIALSAALVRAAGSLAPSRTDPVPSDERTFVAALYPWAWRKAWPSPPTLPPALAGAPDLIARLAVDGPFGSYLRRGTDADGIVGEAPPDYVVDVDGMLAYRPRPGLLAPGGKAHLRVDGADLRTVALTRGGDPVPLAAWRGRQPEVDAFLAGLNEDLTTIRHNVFVHLATLTSFAVATTNRLGPDHPVRRLLHHCFHTVLIGNRELGQLQLGGPSGFAATIFSHDHAEVARMATDRLASYDFWDFEPETQFSRRGTGTTPFAYPYRDNVLELWGSTLAYVRRYLSIYFDDESIARDQEVGRWLDDLERLLPGGLGSHERGLDRLARLCATLIHVSTVEHDVLNNVTWDYSTLGWLIPTVAPLNGQRMDQRRAFDLMATLIVTWKPYNMLLTADVPSLALDPEGRQAMADWIADLGRIQARMAARGRSPSLSYPENLNVSISN